VVSGLLVLVQKEIFIGNVLALFVTVLASFTVEMLVRNVLEKEDLDRLVPVRRKMFILKETVQRVKEHVILFLEFSLISVNLVMERETWEPLVPVKQRMFTREVFVQLVKVDVILEFNLENHSNNSSVEYL